MTKFSRQPKEILILLAMIVGLSFALAGLQSVIINASVQLHPIMFVAPESGIPFGMSFPQEVRTAEFMVVGKGGEYPDPQETIHYFITQKPKPFWPEPEDCEQGFGSDPEDIWKARDYCEANPEDFNCCYRSICRYLEKISEEDEGDYYFHATVSPKGGEDTTDYWLLKFHVPTIDGFVGQDYDDIPIPAPGEYGCDINIVTMEGTYCGDGTKQRPNDFGVGGPENDGYEDCDGEDGVPPNGYYCAQNCVLEHNPEPYCGDGNVDLGEECDEGENNGVPCIPPYGSSCNYCSIECEEITFPGPKCGDGNIDRPDEDCEYNEHCLLGMSCIYCKCVIEEEPGECDPGATEACSTGSLGICEVGVQTCDIEGFWGNCIGVNEPISEICDNYLDDDCDGDIDCADSDCDGSPTCGEIVIYGGGGGTIYLAISNEANKDSQTDTATVNWFTNLPATSRVIYDTVSHSTLGSPPNYGYAFSTPEDSNKVTFHTVTITGLIPETTYYWRAVSHTSPDEVLGDEMTFATEVPLPEIPPTEGPPEEIPPEVPPEVPPEETPPTEVPPEEGTKEEPAEGEDVTIGGVPKGEEPETGLGQFLAAIGSFFNLENPCWIFFFFIIILIILFLLSKKRDGKRRGGLFLITIILIVIYCFSCRSNCWILILVAVVSAILSLIFKRKKKEELHEEHHIEHSGF